MGSMLNRRCMNLLLGGAAAPQLFGAGAAEPNPKDGRVPIRIVVSKRFAPELNENDAKAALQAWGDALARQGRLYIDQIRPILTSSDDLIQLVRRGEADAMGVTIPELLQVRQYLDLEVLIVDENAVKSGDPYVLLTASDSGLKSLEELRGHSLVLHRGPRASMAEVWLTTLLAEAKLPLPESFFGRVTDNNNISRGVVLPVFFRQADACVVTSRGFSTMCELNPQLAKKLKVMAVSPPIVTGVVVFHKECSAVRRDTLKSALLELHQTVFGKQALTLFQTGRLVATGKSILQNATELMATYERIRGRQGMGRR